MQISTEKRRGVLVVSIFGSITATDSAALADDERLCGCAEKTVIDLASVDFLDSSGLGSLVKIVKKFKDAQVPLAFSSPGPFVDKTLKMTRLDKVVAVESSIDLAVELLLKEN